MGKGGGLDKRMIGGQVEKTALKEDEAVVRRGKRLMWPLVWMMGFAVGMLCLPALGENQPPEIVWISATPSWIVEYRAVTLTTTAIDPEGDSMEAIWSSPDGGAMEGTGWTVQFRAPALSAAAMFRIRLVVVDEHGAQSDPAETQVEVRMAGDADGDNHVTLLDVAILSGAYRTSTADANYNENADFDRNGVVDVYDLTILSTNYGR